MHGLCRVLYNHSPCPGQTQKEEEDNTEAKEHGDAILLASCFVAVELEVVFSLAWEGAQGEK